MPRESTRSIALMHRVTPETASRIRDLQIAWGLPEKPLSAAAVVAEAIRQAHERLKPKARKA